MKMEIKQKYYQGVVIPCLNEFNHIFKLLDSLIVNSYFTKTLVVIVINNLKNEEKDNLKTIAKLTNNYQNYTNLVYLDYSQDRCFKKKEGVGLARALGFDYLKSWLSASSPYIWLDADCLVEKDFLEEINLFYKDKDNVAGWVTFTHQVVDDDSHNTAVKVYEEFLYNHYENLKECGTIYAYPTIGSTITCRQGVYERIGGCDRKRLAGEDFYFLQNLTKYGYQFKQITTVMVYPSGRFSSRVPFGTGKKIAKIVEQGYLEVYNPKCYAIIKYFIEEISKGNDGLNNCPYDELLEFLQQQYFFKKWQKIKNNSKRGQELQNFHIWFDAFKVFKLIIFLSKSYPLIRKSLSDWKIFSE